MSWKISFAVLFFSLFFSSLSLSEEITQGGGGGNYTIWINIPENYGDMKKAEDEKIREFLETLAPNAVCSFTDELSDVGCYRLRHEVQGLLQNAINQVAKKKTQMKKNPCNLKKVKVDKTCDFLEE